MRFWYLVTTAWAQVQGLFRKLSPPTEAHVALAMMLMTHEQEISCDEVRDLIDQFAEMQLRGENPAHLFPLVQLHLDMCPECREEFEALLAALEVTPTSIYNAYPKKPLEHHGAF